MDDKMDIKKVPQWVLDKVTANLPKEEVIFVGKMGADGVIDGKLPNGEIYYRNIRSKRRRK
jgi:hypothetical protein